MLDNTTKQKINTLRDILVGKVSDPKSQVEQITIAMFYKFMWDMDNELVNELGAKPKFFTGDFAKYSWEELFAPSLGGEEMLSLYKEAVEKMENNPNIPSAFRDIFRRAYLPYNDPSTLRMFLKVINDGFHYSHSEMLGDAFEYLLSILGTQGDAGQFRTPRHIIDFITECVNPQKGDVICDPACGTAGFVISAYKHILKQNTDKTSGDKLSPSDKKKLGDNLIGLDIDPMMVKLALANMYLHGFNDPHIAEYDSLTNEDRWNDNYDVVLANPPFMTPKGGIRPHKRFTTQASKAEVLFVDLISTHLSANGRAGIIVPNGVVATTQNAYKNLRKMIIKDSLIAVISLPAGVFQPYSGVKTSILILDKAVNKKTDSILFLKAESDGYDLGSNRTPIDKNDLPNILAALERFKDSVNNGNDFCVESQDVDALVVEKKNILINRDVLLSGNKYRKRKEIDTEYPLVQVSDVSEFQNGFAFKSKEYVSEGYRVIRITNVQSGLVIDNDPKYFPSNRKDEIEKYILKENDMLISLTGNVGRVGLIKNDLLPAALNQRVGKLTPKSDVNPNFLFWMLNNKIFENEAINASSGSAQLNLSSKWVEEFQIPLPPTDVQDQIVDEIEGYQKIIDGARMVVDNYKPAISIKPHWDMVELGSVCEIKGGGTPLRSNKEFWNGNINWITCSDFSENEMFISNSINKITELGLNNSSTNLIPSNTIILVTRVSLGKLAIIQNDMAINQDLRAILLNKEKVNTLFAYYILKSYSQEIIDNGSGATVQGVTINFVKELPFPLPSIIEQEVVVKEMEFEKNIIESNKDLIDLYEQKIQKRIAQVWGEDE